MKKYKVNEIFFSLQGEGSYVGTPMLFVRFAQCDLNCKFCDTNHLHYEELSLEDLLIASAKTYYNAIQHRGMGAKFPVKSPAPIVCFTGGEPTLQLDENLLKAFHKRGFTRLHIESNGIQIFSPLFYSKWIRALKFIECLTLSPKTLLNAEDGAIKQLFASPKQMDLKIVYDTDNERLFDLIENWGNLKGWTNKFLQPVSGIGDDIDSESVVDALITKYEGWKLSFQSHKVIGVR